MQKIFEFNFFSKYVIGFAPYPVVVPTGNDDDGDDGASMLKPNGIIMNAIFLIIIKVLV